MHWSDEAIILAVRPHGETSAIAELLTRGHGRHAGLVRGGRSRRLRPVLQPGNKVSGQWRARLAEHLGTLSLELAEPFSARAFDDPLALAVLGSVCALSRLVPERDPHPALYDALVELLGLLEAPDILPEAVVRWELVLLSELGFGLDLSACAATGTREELIYVSPKSGRAVSAGAGAPYADKLLALPEFLRPEPAAQGNGTPHRPPAPEDILAGLALTAYFLEHHLLIPGGLRVPAARARLVDLIGRRARGNAGAASSRDKRRQNMQL